jgi:hypothetical protein
MKKKLISFRCLPGSWGLVGQSYAEAEANYYYEGEELDRKLAEIRFKDDPAGLKVALANIDHKHKKITDYQLEVIMAKANGRANPAALAEIDFAHGKISKYDYEKIVIENSTKPGSAKRESRLLDLEFEHGNITKYEYEKAVIEASDMTDTDRAIKLLELDCANGKISKEICEKEVFTLLKKPWVGVIGQSLNMDQGINGFMMELDWNEYWIEYLDLNGYTGTEDQMIEAWFANVNNDFQSDETVAILPLARHMRKHFRDNGTVY